MPSSSLIVSFLLTLSFTLSTQIYLGRERSLHQQTRAGGVLETLMGDSRRLFANHFITKADVYLHNGVYPSIFDQAQRDKKSHLAKEAVSPGGTENSKATESVDEHGQEADDHHESESGQAHQSDEDKHHHHDAVSGFLQKPRDWIDSFGRNFYPTKHVHLDEKGNQREILPWLRLAAELNPNEIETFTVGAYWLRQRMGKVKEAEEFLREGWRANPDSFEILFELGRLQEENHQDDLRARNLYELALRRWQATEAPKEKRDDLTFMLISGRLAKVEERAHHLDKAIAYLEMLRKVSPAPETIQKQIAELRAKSTERPPG